MKKWYEIKNYTDKAEILIYDQIGSGFWSSGIEAKDLVKEIGDIKASQIDIRINSPGGSVFDGIAIYNAIKRHPAKKTTYNDGLAASIASVIFLAGDKKVSAENAMTMIHNPFGMVMGDANEMRKMADVLDKLKESIVMAYQKSTMLTDKELQAAMDAETWYTATEAKDIGFVDEITGESDSSAIANFNFQKLGYNKVPINFVNLMANSKQKTLFGGVKNMGVETEEKKSDPVVQVVPNATAADIVMLATQNGYGDKAAEWIRAGKSTEAVAMEILNLKRTAPLPQAAAELVSMSDKEQKQYSLTRAINSMVAQQEGRGIFSGFEKDISDEIAKKLPSTYKAKGGFFVPLNLRGDFRNAALDSKTAGRGVETVFDQPGELIEMLRNASVVSRLGARTLTGLTGPIVFPKQTGGLTLYWNGENPGADVTESNITFGVNTLSPKTCQATTAYSRQLLATSSIDVEGMVRQEFAISHALGWDLAALHGGLAASEPVGIYNISGVNSKAMGGVPTFAKLIDMTTECALDNALLGTLGWVTTPGMAGKMMQTLVASSAGSTFIWSGNQIAGSMAGYGAIASNQVKATLGGGSDHGIVFGNYADLVIGMWGAMELIVDIYARKKAGLVEVTSFQMVDILVRHPESFCVATGATIS